MNAVCADAGYWIALFNPRGQLHTKAITVSTTLQGRPIVTSQMVLTEFLNYYAAPGQPFRQRAVQVVRSLQDDPDVAIVPQTEAQFPTALTLYAQRPDKEWGELIARLSLSCKNGTLRKCWHTMTISPRQVSFLSCVTVRGKPYPCRHSPEELLSHMPEAYLQGVLEKTGSRRRPWWSSGQNISRLTATAR
jgi:hypothetical protein